MRRFPFDGEQFPPTPEQRTAILSDAHTLIEAGAGSGKTSTLVDKIVHLLGAERFDGVPAAEPCELHEIAAITFTNASAADFRRKLRARLAFVADYHAERGEGAEEQRWRARVHEVDRARIGTIHSFCGGILREFGLRVGLDPRFTILDEGEAAIARAECARQTLRDALEADDARAVLACAAFGVNGAQGVVERLLRQGALVSASYEAWFAEGDVVERLRAALVAAREELELEGGVAEWNDALDPEAARLAGAALGLARDAHARLEQELAAQSALDFDGLVARTLAVLRERPDVLRALRRRLRWLFIDEFQDTDADQLAIAELIAGVGEGAADGRSLRGGTSGAAVPRSPRLCIVGDPKQSIYRFRGADVTVWRSALELFEGLGIEPVRLVKNFRSRSPIVGFVNATFDGLIGTARRAVMQSGQEVEFAPLAPHHLHDDERCVELLAPAVKSGTNAEERRRHETRCIATRLQELHGQPIADGRGGERTLQWSDMAILFRAREPMARAEEELRALGIPCYVAGGSGFFARREVRDVRLLLRAIADPHDDLAWLGVLRSPFVGVRDATLFQVRATQRHRPLSHIFELQGIAGSDARALARAGQWLLPLVELRDRVPTAELMDLAIERSGYGAQLLTRAGGKLALANLRKLSRLAEGRAGETLGEFLAWIEEREGGEARDGDAALYTAGEEVVTLTTVHGAKGLEWDVVVLADIAGREIVSTRRQADVLMSAGAGVGLRMRDAEKNEAGLWTCLAEREGLLARSEEKRLWYVAATRAKARLIVCGSDADVGAAAAVGDSSRDAKSVSEWMLRALTSAEDGYTYGYGGGVWTAHESIVPAAEHAPRQSVEVPALEQVLSAAGAAVGAHAALAAQLRPVVAPIVLPRRSATELMALARGEIAWRERHGASAVLRRVRGIPARVIGDVVHGALEEARDAHDLLDYLETELVSRSGEPAGSSVVRAAIEQARALVERAREHPDVVRFAEAGGEHELAFTWFARSTSGVHQVRGAMDMVAIVDGVPEILDFKSTAIAAGGEREAAEPYRVQRATYAAALHTLLGVAPARFTFLFPASGGTHVDELDGTTVAAGHAEVHALLDSALSAGASSLLDSVTPDSAS